MSSENVKARVIATVTGREYVPTTTVELQPGQEVVDRPTGTPSDPLGPDPTGENLMRVLDLPSPAGGGPTDSNERSSEELARVEWKDCKQGHHIPGEGCADCRDAVLDMTDDNAHVVQHVHIVAREGEYPPSNYFLTEQDVRDVYEAEQAGMSLGMYHFFS